MHVKNALDRENKCRLYHRGFAVAFAQFGQVSRFMSSEFGKGRLAGQNEAAGAADATIVAFE